MRVVSTLTAVLEYLRWMLRSYKVSLTLLSIQTPVTPAPEAPHSSPTKLKWRRPVPEKRGLVVKDVVCLPSGHPRGHELSHSVPWGRERAELEALGLVTRMSIDESWSAHEMESRLASLFKRRFSSKQGQAVSFTYLKVVNITFRQMLCESRLGS